MQSIRQSIRRATSVKHAVNNAINQAGNLSQACSQSGGQTGSHSGIQSYIGQSNFLDDDILLFALPPVPLIFLRLQILFCQICMCMKLQCSPTNFTIGLSSGRSVRAPAPPGFKICYQVKCSCKRQKKDEKYNRSFNERPAL
jgi:hypothetical protein